VRRLVEAGNREISEEVDRWQALIALEGSFARWTWQLALADAQSDGTTVKKGFLSMPRLYSSLGPSGLDDSGNIVCGSPDRPGGYVPAENVIPDCVPLNLFGGAGSITEQQLAYVVSKPLVNHGTNEQSQADFELSGPAGRMLGRELKWILGGNYRREAGSLAQDPIEAYEFAAFQPKLHGAYDVRELFAEGQFPLLHDRPWATDMAMNIGVRWSDFSSFGEHTSWQAGLRWLPSDELTLRANYADVFRAPSIGELYDPQLRFDEYFDIDPCGNQPTPSQQANCAANGVPGGAYIQGDAGFTAIAGGNPDVEPEIGYSVGAGIIYSPAWAKGLSASADYFQVKLRDYIWQAWPHHVLFECAEHGTKSMCDDIRRSPDGRVSQVATLTENFGGLEVRGVDVAFDWSATNTLGNFRSRVLATYLDRWDLQTLPGGEVLSFAGNFDAGARPRWRASGYVDWRFGAWTVGYAAEFIGSYSERIEPRPDYGLFYDAFDRRVEPALYHDIEAGFSFDSGVAVRAAITNVTDEDPPYLNVAPGNTDVATYRLLGRTYFLELRYQVQ
jgi:outer membrane receptor protein involved in Fe transport